jgi:hypothetical protein
LGGGCRLSNSLDGRGSHYLLPAKIGLGSKRDFEKLPTGVRFWRDPEGHHLAKLAPERVIPEPNDTGQAATTCCYISALHNKQYAFA